MSVRNGLLGFAAGLAAATAVAAEPPGSPAGRGPRVEPGRPPVPRGRTPDVRVRRRTRDGGDGVGRDASRFRVVDREAVWEVLVDRMTMPLGTAPMEVWD